MEARTALTGFATIETVASPTGAKLSLRGLAPDAPPRAIIHINHGLSEHSARYGRLAQALAGAGFAAYAHDHRGHGETTAPGAPLGHIGPGADLNTVLADMKAVQDEIRDRHPGLPLILFGHSMGGMLAMNYTLHHGGNLQAPLAGAAIWNAPFATRTEALAGKAVLAWEQFRLGSDVPSRIMPKLAQRAWARAFPDRRTDADWLSRDESEVDAVIADPKCSADPSIAIWQMLFDTGLGILDKAAWKTVPRSLPFHLVGGGADPSTGNGRTVLALEKRLRQNGFLNLETRIYPENRHESLNELNRNAVTADFIAWLEKIIN